MLATGSAAHTGSASTPRGGYSGQNRSTGTGAASARTSSCHSLVRIDTKHAGAVHRSDEPGEDPNRLLAVQAVMLERIALRYLDVVRLYQRSHNLPLVLCSFALIGSAINGMQRTLPIARPVPRNRVVPDRQDPARPLEKGNPFGTGLSHFVPGFASPLSGVRGSIAIAGDNDAIGRVYKRGVRTPRPTHVTLGQESSINEQYSFLRVHFLRSEYADIDIYITIHHYLLDSE